jgi:CHAT domain-containing protein/Tfp pilus assembly protein PilF
LQRRAEELVKQAEHLSEQGEFQGATKLWKQAMAIFQRLYPKSQYPEGHAQLAIGLNNLGLLLRRQTDYEAAWDYFQQALAMRHALYPKERFPHGHREVAGTLSELGSLLRDQGDYPGARRYHEQALAMCQALYPKAKFPDGNLDLSTILNNLGGLFANEGNYTAARSYFQQALAMRQALYPKDQFPRGHSRVATILNNLGGVLLDQGDYPAAQRYLQQALTMRQALYPKDKFPRGHFELAHSIDNLGLVFMRQGDYAAARGYYEQGLAMWEALYPRDRFSQGNPDLAISLDNLGVVLRLQGDGAGASSYAQQALAMRRALYPKEKNPRGHPHLALSLNNLGGLLRDQGEYVEARDYFQQALAMLQAFYPETQFPHGHPNVAQSLNNLGALLQNQGDYTGARGYHLQALNMRRALYREDQFPYGHPYLAETLSNLGTLLLHEGDYPGALAYCQQALDMYQELAEILMPAISEAEALNYLASLPLQRDVFLSISSHLPASDAASYGQVWRSKGAILRVQRSRQQALRLLADPESRDLWERLIQTRRDLARLILSPPRDRAFHLKRLQQLTELKEKLERDLAERSMPFRRQQELERVTPTDLAQKLPPGSVFIDLLRYVHFEQDPKIPGRKGERRTLRYVAFVLRPGQPPVSVELGEAGPIDAAVAAWRRDRAGSEASAAAETLRRLVWDHLAPHLASDTRTVLVAPDGALTQLQWAALPGDRAGSVLLEDYAFAVVPNGPFLLERLTAAPESEPNPGRLLAVGGVQYDQQIRPLPELQPEQLVAWRPAERGSRTLWSAERAARVVEAAAAGPFQVFPLLLTVQPSWSYLPGTLREIEAVSKLADPRPVQMRRGAEANTAQLLEDLPQARYALLATHGFFADPQFRSVFLLDEAAFRHQGPEGRATPGARNPLVLSGLVLAGANQPPAADAEGMSVGDGSILTAEMIASLPLEHMELVVLSACETGLGEVAGGEGVYGLQRAFHMAGAQTTVASLWQVDDEITQELLTRFFENLWHKGMGRLEALRQAQLAVRRGEGNRADPRYWAAWVLSGDPGKLDSSPSTVLAESPEAVAGATWWSSWPWYAAGLGVLGIVVLGLVALRHRRTAR